MNDVLHFVRSGDIAISRAFDVLSFLAQEEDYYVWAGALGQLDWIRRRLEHIPAAYDEFSVSYFIINNLNNNISTNQSPLKMLQLTIACHSASTNCIKLSCCHHITYYNFICYNFTCHSNVWRKIYGIVQYLFLLMSS